MSKEHHLVVVPGLGGANVGFRKIVHSWDRYGFTPHIFDPGWRDEEIQFQPKLQRLLDKIDELCLRGGTVSLVGTSAGGSAALNAFCERKSQIHKVVNICGRLRSGQNVRPSLEMAAKSSPAFKESVLLFEKREPTLRINDRKKVLTIRAIFDEIVPTTTTTLEGATNIKIFSVEHMLSITAAMTIYSRHIFEFIQRGSF